MPPISNMLGFIVNSLRGSANVDHDLIEKRLLDNKVLSTKLISKER